MTDLIAVRVGDCACPDQPHADGDFVHLRPKLSWRHVQAIKWDVMILKERSTAALPVSEIMGILSEGYLLYGIADWNLTVPLTRESVQTEILENIDRAILVSDQADELYGPQVMLPLASLGSKSSPGTSINGSISPTNGSSPKRPKRSSRSSTSTSPTEGTATITSVPAGDSNS